MSRKKATALAFFISLYFSLVFAIFPFSRDFSLLRPEFVCLLVIYWVVFLPQLFGVTFAFGIGLLQDVVEGGVWGAHALAYTVLGYICLFSWQRIRSYSIWQQSAWVFVLVGTHQVIVSWVKGLEGYPASTHTLVLPTMASALCWPILFVCMQNFKIRLRRL